MRFKKTLVACMTAAAFCGPGLASAGDDFLFNWGATTEGPAGVSDTVRSMKFTAESVVVFHGVPFATGTTFTDYIVIRIDQLFDSSNNEVIPYGARDSQQITVLAELTGTQTNTGGGNNYAVTGINSFSMYYDGPLGGFTNANYGQASLASFTDGQLVESAAFVSGLGTNATTSTDGVLDMTLGLVDLLAGSDFELRADGSVNPLGWVAFSNSNNHLCGTPLQTCASSKANILAAFGEADVFGFHTISDGSLEKSAIVVPEPETYAMLLAGLGLMGFIARRRTSARHVA